MRPPQLQGHDYQFVMYRPQAVQWGGELWIFVDRDTGEELWFVMLM